MVPNANFTAQDNMMVLCAPGFALGYPRTVLECGMDGNWNRTVQCLPAVQVANNTVHSGHSLDVERQNTTN